ncbi:MAG TPA: FKBP-type peptidyl-prolyl cis-trans isomerase [Candidatus Dormibacteraeota bacterium]
MLILAAAAALAACGYADPYAGQGQAATSQSGGPSPSPGAGSKACLDLQGKTPVRFPDGLQIIDLVTGTGATAASGDTVKVTYTGYLQSNCSVFDSTVKEGGQPFSVALGTGSVIKGWEEGLPGMKVGGTRKLIIPAALGYGSQGQGQAIPPNATLVFDISMLSAGPTPSPSPSPSPKASPTP